MKISPAIGSRNPRIAVIEPDGHPGGNLRVFAAGLARYFRYKRLAGKSNFEQS
jgi:hypothetical protein